MAEENDTQKPSREAVDPASAGSALLAAWVNAARKVRLNVNMREHAEKPSLIQCVDLTISMTHTIKGKIEWHASIGDYPEEGWSNMLHSGFNSGSGKGSHPFVAVKKAIADTIREIGKGDVLDRHLKTALRQAWKLMQNTDYPEQLSR